MKAFLCSKNHFRYYYPKKGNKFDTELWQFITYTLFILWFLFYLIFRTYLAFAMGFIITFIISYLIYIWN